MSELIKQLENDDIWFCPLPFTHIYSSLSGRYAPCYDAPAKTGHNMKDTTIQEWYTSDYQNKLRSEMLSINPDKKYLSEHCAGCWKQEKKYNRSDRMKYREQILSGKFDSKVPELLELVDQFKQNGEVKLEKRVLDLKMKMFGNACNLDCYMCTPRSASTRTASLKKLKNVYDPDLDPYDIPRMNTERLDDEKYLNDIASVAEYIASIKLIGGEPLVMKNHYKLLDKLVDSGHSNGISLIYKTNLSVFDLDDHNFLDYLPHFREFVMKTSIDSYGKHNDYCRKKSNWEELDFNLRLMRSKKNVRVNVHSVVSFLSVLRFYELQEYLSHQNIDNTYYILDYPSILNVNNLPKDIKEELIPKYQNYPNIVEALKKDWDMLEFVKTIEYIQELDNLHNDNLWDIYPELKPYYEKAKGDLICS